MTMHIPNLESDRCTETTARLATPTINTSLYRKVFKRGFDIIAVVLSAPVVLPLIIVLAAMISLLTGGKPFYTQLRVGRDSKKFRIFKMRTMVRNADELLENHLRNNPAARIEWEATQKLKNDPRITSLGRILRKTSADELPQLFNVLIGDMSLVGPRPMMVDQQKYYHGSAYYDMRPGITGLWQVSDRNDCNFSDRVSFDNEYGAVLSLKTDLSVLCKTMFVVVRATGH